MAVANVSLGLRGNLLARAATCNNPTSNGTNGPTFPLQLRADNSTVSAEFSSTYQPIDSPSPAFVSLPLPTNLAARFFYIRTLTDAPLLMRLTFETTGVQSVPLRGLYMQEYPSDDRVTLVELQGQGSVEWLAGGDIV